MRSISLFARRGAAALGIAALALTGATFGNANAATAGPGRPDQNVAGGAVLVKRVVTAGGTLEVFEGTAPRPAGVRPYSSHGCAGSNPSVCLTIQGSGLYVDSMENDTYISRAGGIDLQINGPGGVITDSGWFTASAGHHYWYWWPQGYVTGGYYCATAYVGGGHEGACNTVHN